MNINLNKTIYIKDFTCREILEVEQIQLLSESQTLCSYEDKFIIVNKSDILDDILHSKAKKLINSRLLRTKYREKDNELANIIYELEKEIF